MDSESTVRTPACERAQSPAHEGAHAADRPDREVALT